MAVEDLAQQLAACKPGHSLPRAFYTEPGVHAFDLAAVWYRHWILVAHDVEIPHPGDYVTRTVGDHQLVIVRGDDGVLRALHNVCRHRGSLLCDATSGNTRRRLVCPYHQWSYNLDGTLARARKTPGDFDPGDHGLAAAACEIAGGMIFVSLADRPPGFGPMKALTDSYLAPFDLGTARVAATSTVIENGNWKLVMENNRECLHCRGAHPLLCTTFPEAPLHSGGATGNDLVVMERLIERCEALGLPSAFVAAPDLQFRAMRMPFVGDARSMTVDGRPAVAKRFGNLPEWNLGDVLLYHYPSTWSHFMADHAVTFRLVPISATSTQLTTTWLVPGDAVEGIDYDVDELTHVWMTTNREDTALVERAQRGVSSPAYRPGLYSPEDEAGVAQFVDWYRAQALDYLSTDYPQGDTHD